jgi:hypothetical protein
LGVEGVREVDGWIVSRSNWIEVDSEEFASENGGVHTVPDLKKTEPSRRMPSRFKVL